MIKKLLLPILFVLLLLLPGFGFGATYYVCETATGTESGDSFANCMDVADHNGGSFSAGDVIYLCDAIDGIGNKIVPPDSGASAESRITYRGDYAGHACTLDVTAAMWEPVTKSYLTLMNIAGGYFRDQEGSYNIFNNIAESVFE